ncbi:hypothetical protein EB061_11045, partial [bacterium]|nr:hypothetical protein [bacterium]
MSKVLNSTMLILFLILSLLSPEANSARVLGVGRDPNARMTQADFDDLPLCYAGYNGVIAADFALTAGQRCREGLNIYRYDGGCTPQNDRKGLTRVFYGKGCLKALGKVKIIADTSKEKNRKSYEWKKVSDSPINDKPDTDSPADRASETPSRRNRSSSNITVTTTTVRIKCEQVDRQLDWFAAEDVTAEDLKKRLNEAKKELDDVSKKVWEGMSTCHDQCFDAVMTDKGACSLETVFIKDKMKLCEVLDKGDLPLPSSVSGPPVQSTFSKDKFFNALSPEERATCQKYAKNDASLLCKRIYSNEGCAEYLKGTDFGAFCDQSARWLDDLKVAQEAYDYAKKRYDLYVNGKDTLCSFTSEKATEKEVAKLDVTTLSGSCLMELLSSCGEYEERIEQRKSSTCVNCDLRQQQLCAMGYCPGGV